MDEWNYYVHGNHSIHIFFKPIIRAYVFKRPCETDMRYHTHECHCSNCAGRRKSNNKFIKKKYSARAPTVHWAYGLRIARLLLLLHIYYGARELEKNISCNKAPGLSLLGLTHLHHLQWGVDTKKYTRVQTQKWIGNEHLSHWPSHNWVTKWQPDLIPSSCARSRRDIRTLLITHTRLFYFFHSLFDVEWANTHYCLLLHFQSRSL